MTRKRSLLFSVVLLLATGCGHVPSSLGVTVERVRFSKRAIGPAPTDLPSRQFSSGPGFHRARRADLLDGHGVQVLSEVADRHGIEIRDLSGELHGHLSTADYLTDFGVVDAEEGGPRWIVLYSYPNARRGGTFTVVTPDGRAVATWDESPPPGRFAAGRWENRPALFYLQGDQLTIRSPRGQGLASLNVPEGRIFSSVLVGRTGQGRMVLVASGNGYTPYHTVCVYDADGALLFQDVAEEQAFTLETREDDEGFVVSTRSTEWRYDEPPKSP
jgi:hypothetical protein